jgi:hypothetical protein
VFVAKGVWQAAYEVEQALPARFNLSAVLEIFVWAEA